MRPDSWLGKVTVVWGRDCDGATRDARDRQAGRLPLRPETVTEAIW